MAHFENTGNFLYVSEDILWEYGQLEDLEDVAQLQDPDLILPDGITKEYVRRTKTFSTLASVDENIAKPESDLLENSSREGPVQTTFAPSASGSSPSQTRQSPQFTLPQPAGASFLPLQPSPSTTFSPPNDPSEAMYIQPTSLFQRGPAIPSNTGVASLPASLLNQQFFGNRPAKRTDFLRAADDDQFISPESVETSTGNEDVAAKLLPEPSYNSKLPWPLSDLWEQDEPGEIYDKEFPAP
jgi:hypothetical protein